METKNLIGMTQEEIGSCILSMGEKLFRAKQIYHSLYRRQCLHFEQMSDLSLQFRARLLESFRIELPRTEKILASVDGTEKFLLELADGHYIEMVHIPEPGRDTLCLSSQVGCNAACRFCVTGTLGLARNLQAGEILAQVLLLAGRRPGILKRLNLVFMGMGEPLLNYQEVMKAFRLLTDPQGLAISPRHITLSTCGIVPGLLQLAAEPVIPLLAISLGAANDELRSQLIPINRKWNLEQLIAACQAIPVRKRITFEYTLLRGVNDRPEDIRRLVQLLSRLPTKINLIPLNPHPAIPFEPPPEEEVRRFQEELFRHGISAFLRKPRGEDIQAACGQLSSSRRASSPFSENG